MRYAFPGDLTSLPVGMRAISRYWAEPMLLRIAYAAEQALERRRPAIFFPIS
jgi:Asp-tRNA(Asn)/Glu-tRNA(Gln) amidotransferase A subunit family amidase